MIEVCVCSRIELQYQLNIQKNSLRAKKLDKAHHLMILRVSILCWNSMLLFVGQAQRVKVPEPKMEHVLLLFP